MLEDIKRNKSIGKTDDYASINDSTFKYLNSQDTELISSVMLCLLPW